MFKTLAGAAALAFAAAVVTASATQAADLDPDAASVKVSLADLNLSSTSGAATALRRIRFAAQAICGGEPARGDLAAGAHYDACLRSTVNTAVVKLNNPLLASLGGVALKDTQVAAAGR